MLKGNGGSELRGPLTTDGMAAGSGCGGGTRTCVSASSPLHRPPTRECLGRA